MKNGASVDLVDVFSNNAESNDRNPAEANKLEIERAAMCERSLQVA